MRSRGAESQPWRICRRHCIVRRSPWWVAGAGSRAGNPALPVWLEHQLWPAGEVSVPVPRHRQQSEEVDC